MKTDNDYNYIIKVISYLNESHNISFFITSSDFDVLYSWWIKRIPEQILYNSIDVVVERWKSREKEIDGFKRFSYEVRKNFNNFMELKVSSSDNRAEDLIEKKYGEIEGFLTSLPEKIVGLRNDLLKLSVEEDRDRKQTFLDEISEKMVALHLNDPELKLKTKKFIMNLNPQIRTVQMEKKYQINFLFSKYKFPESLLSFPDTDNIG